jgi:glycosyltransferase involved in cell wall biosynthesis
MKPRSQKPQSFLIVSPEFQNHHGGVQTYSRLMYQSVQSLYPDSVVRLIDYNADSFSRFPSLNILTKIRVALRILFQCWLTHPICLVTHVDLAPVTHIAKKLFGTTYLLSCHGIEVWSPLSAAKTRALEQADQLLAVSRFTARRIGDSSPTVKANISIFPNTFELTSPAHSRDAAKQWLSDRYGLAPSPLVLFTLSRLRPADREKGYFSALRAAAIIRERGIDCCLIIGGSGPDEEPLRTEARQLGFEKHLDIGRLYTRLIASSALRGQRSFSAAQQKRGVRHFPARKPEPGNPCFGG